MCVKPCFASNNRASHNRANAAGTTSAATAVHCPRRPRPLPCWPLSQGYALQSSSWRSTCATVWRTHYVNFRVHKTLILRGGVRGRWVRSRSWTRRRPSASVRSQSVRATTKMTSAAGPARSWPTARRKPARCGTPATTQNRFAPHFAFTPVWFSKDIHGKEANSQLR